MSFDSMRAAIAFFHMTAENQGKYLKAVAEKDYETAQRIVETV